MERLHVHYLRELVHRLRSGVSQRQIAHDLGLARMTVQKYAQLAAECVAALARGGGAERAARTATTAAAYAIDGRAVPRPGGAAAG